jgi:signal transduction histidine kinase
LLALARGDGHRPQRQPVDIASVITQRHEAWRPLAAEHNVDLRLDLPDEPLVADIVPGHLDQILDNLIDNALDATPSGRAVILRADPTRAGVEVHVTDEGKGMSEDDRQRAFAPFWQGSERHANGHTGLGLAIVDQLVRANNGAIVLDRGATGGTDAVIRLPRTQV